MSINLVALRDRLARKIGGGGTHFDSLFLEAVNDVSADLKRDCFLDVGPIETLTDVIGLGREYYPAYREGVAYYLQCSAEFAKEPDPNGYRKYRNALAECQYNSIEALDPDVGNKSAWGD